MTVKELKQFIEELPDDMEVGLVDLTTDDEYDSAYHIKKEQLGVATFLDEDDNESKIFVISFQNKLNENSIIN